MALGERQSAREEHDFYRTPPDVTRGLLVKESFGPHVWEPACGDGAISRVLEERGLDVMSTDLIDRGYGTGGMDFLAAEGDGCPDIVTNPPFKLAEQFVLHALKLGAPRIAMLLRLAWLEGEKRRCAVFTKYPPSRVWILSRRPTLWNGSDPNARTTGGAIGYAWYVWDEAADPGTQLGWIGARDVREAEARELEDLCA